MNESQNLFRRFIQEMNLALKDNHEINGDSQSRLFNQMFKMEREFRSTLLSIPYGHAVYIDFMRFIVEEKGNVLHVRPYFRERQNTFSAKISKAFDEHSPQVLHRFRINYPFAQWVLSHWNPLQDKIACAAQRRKLEYLFQEMKRLRALLCENSLPLAICRSRTFWDKVPESHIEYMDLIQDSSEGLLTAIDKFAPPYKTVFRSTAIGRMTLNMMTDYNATMVKLPPKEKRILYRHGLARNRKNIEDDSKVLDFVKESFEGVTQEALTEIVQAASLTIPLDQKPEDGLSLQDKISSGVNPEDIAEARETAGALQIGVSGLPIIERKIIIMKTGF